MGDQGEAECVLKAGQAKQFYRDMLLVRRFEEKAGQLYGMGLIGGFCHLYIGQEAVAVGIQHALGEKDSVYSPAIAITAICWSAAWIQAGSWQS